MNYCLSGDESVGKVFKNSVNEEDFNLVRIGRWDWSSELFVKVYIVCGLLRRSILLQLSILISLVSFLVFSSCQLWPLYFKLIGNFLGGQPANRELQGFQILMFLSWPLN
jgi:hypothetical protein